MDDKYFKVIRLHRDDLREHGIDARGLTDADMEKIASAVADGLMESGAFSDALEAACENVPTLIKQV